MGRRVDRQWHDGARWTRDDPGSSRPKGQRPPRPAWASTVGTGLPATGFGPARWLAWVDEPVTMARPVVVWDARCSVTSTRVVTIRWIRCGAGQDIDPATPLPDDWFARAAAA